MASGSDTPAFVAFVAGVALLAFLGGSLVTVAEVPPSGWIRDGWRAGVALFEKRVTAADPYTTDLWTVARTDRRGVTRYQPTKAFDGLTLYTSGHDTAAWLITMDGEVVHEWARPYSSIHDRTAAVRDPVPDRQIYFRRAHLFPDGGLLATFTGVGDSPWGYGMVRLNADSSVIWKNLEHFHHDFDIADDGRVYGLTHRFRSDFSPELDRLARPALDDYLTIVGRDGRTERRISLLDALQRSKYRDTLWVLPVHAYEDPLHTNAVDILGEREAQSLSGKIPVAEAGQVLLSFRSPAGGLIGLLDLAREEIVWAMHGQWRSQHDPDILANGNILLFDNTGHRGEGGRSRVIEIDPATGGLVWQYAGNADERFDSVIRAAQQPLPNGNVLITESNSGRLFEVTRAGEIVWEYINPVRGKEGRFIPVVSWAQRIDPATLTADFRAAVTRAARRPGARRRLAREGVRS